MKGTIAFDFDGVISTYEGFKGVDVFGEPIPETITAMQKLSSLGYNIIIFTTRIDTPALRAWLKKYQVPYNDINRNSSFNPPQTSNKPVWQAYVGDRTVRFDVRNHRLSRDDLVSLIESTVAEGMRDAK